MSTPQHSFSRSIRNACDWRDSFYTGSSMLFRYNNYNHIQLTHIPRAQTSSPRFLTPNFTNDKRSLLLLRLSIPNIQSLKGHKSSELPSSKLSISRYSWTCEAQIQELMMKVLKGQLTTCDALLLNWKPSFKAGREAYRFLQISTCLALV